MKTRLISGKIIGFILLSLLSIGETFAQQEEQMSMYMYNPLYYNPAYAGSRKTLNATVLGRFQWVGAKGAPQTQWVSIHSPLVSPRFGIGAHLVNDKIGNSKRTSAFLDLSGNIKLNRKDSRIALGLTAGADILGFDYGSVNVANSSDPTFANGSSNTQINVGVGAYYYGERGYLGISSPRLLEKEQTAGLPTLAVSRHYYLAAGYVFKLNPRIDFKPSVLAKTSANAPLNVDFNASFLFNEKFWLGGMYRLNQAVGVNVSFLVSKSLNIGYAFDFQTNGMARSNAGSHELLIQYELNTKNKRRDGYSPRYF